MENQKTPMIWNNVILRSSWLRLFAFIPIVFSAAAVRAALIGGLLGRGIPYLTFYPAVMIAAFFGGIWAGVGATVLSALLSFFWIQQGTMSFPESLAMAIFVISCMMISGITEARRRAILQAKESNEELQKVIEVRKQIENEREELIRALQEALVKVKQLSGLLPICASCKRIQDDKGSWRQMEAYISDHSDVMFSHGYCPECGKKALEEFEDFRIKNKKD
jgi:K+-sensing histidine kinase KdpD